MSCREGIGARPRLLVLVLFAFAASCALAPSAWATDGVLAEESATVDATATTTDSTTDSTTTTTDSTTTTTDSTTTTTDSTTTATDSDATTTVPAQDAEVVPDGIPTPPTSDVAPPEPLPVIEPVPSDPPPPVAEEVPPSLPPAEVTVPIIPDPIPLPEPVVVSDGAPVTLLELPVAFGSSLHPYFVAAEGQLQSPAGRHGSAPHRVHPATHKVRTPLFPNDSPPRSGGSVGSGGTASPSFAPDTSGTGFTLLALLLLGLAGGGLTVRLRSTVPRPLALICRLERPG